MRLKISKIEAFPLSYRMPEGKIVSLGIGRNVKRDTVLVKVTTDGGIIGYGEAHHGRALGAIAHLINTTLNDLLVGADALASGDAWRRVYALQLASHGMGAATVIGLSGIDIALWDIRGKAAGMPLYQLLGGISKPIPAYAGGIALGYQPPETLVDEAQGLVEAGFGALKLRIGDTPANDCARIEAVRAALGDGIDILTDANANADFEHVRRIMPCLDASRAGWLEEPFPPHDRDLYIRASKLGVTPLAAGENHYMRFDFRDAIADGAISILQPDLSKVGGITEALRVEALAATWKMKLNPHSSASGINMAASVHFLAAIDMPGYFEADVAVDNPFRDRLCTPAPSVRPDGTVLPNDGPGLGVGIDEDFIATHPLIDGPGYVK